MEDLRDDPRWPELATKAEDLQVRGVMCLRLGAARSVGHLTVYSCWPGAFPPESQRLGEIFAAVATMFFPPPGDATSWPARSPPGT